MEIIFGLDNSPLAEEAHSLAANMVITLVSEDAINNVKYNLKKMRLNVGYDIVMKFSNI